MHQSNYNRTHTNITNKHNINSNTKHIPINTSFLFRLYFTFNGNNMFASILIVRMSHCSSKLFLTLNNILHRLCVQSEFHKQLNRFVIVCCFVSISIKNKITSKFNIQSQHPQLPLQPIYSTFSVDSELIMGYR